MFDNEFDQLMEEVDNTVSEAFGVWVKGNDCPIYNSDAADDTSYAVHCSHRNTNNKTQAQPGEPALLR
ncbi:hypothetical protein, partial [Bradyrhizobium canariense]|uniref:hypothetical protein n=1 Tax=Bradyrhizobium canariense TaxID=255045 RepID=UPI003CC7ECD9